jgi:hypothetical protein
MIEGGLHVDGIRISEVSHIVPHISGEYKTQAETCHYIPEWEEQRLTTSQSLLQDEPDGSVSGAHWTTMTCAICDNYITPSKSEYYLLKSFFKAVAMAKPLYPELEARSQEFSTQI